jgi:thioesterase domain-containing protein/acyl carrier protein
MGVPGEIWIGGAGLATGYLDRPELSAERFIPDPFDPAQASRLYRTGDRGRWRHDGWLEHLGRLDHQVKVRGHRIELGEIEAILNRQPRVLQSLVVVRDVEPGDSRIIAYLVSDATDLDTLALREAMKQDLPDYMLPQHLVCLPAMPLLPNGKIDRQALPMPQRQRAEERSGGPTTFSPVERDLAALWSELLHLDTVGLDDNFFDLGGHSLLVMRMMTRIEDSFGVRLPLSALLAADTVRAMARKIEHDSSHDSLVLIHAGNPGATPLFIVHDGDGETLLYRNLAQALAPSQAVYGLQPLSDEHAAMHHTRIPQMARFYIERMQSVCPHGPYLLAGFCAGGVIAFEMALQLQDLGEELGFLGLLDAPDVDAAVRPGFVARRRLRSFATAFDSEPGVPFAKHLMRSVERASQKVRGLIDYGHDSRAEHRRIQQLAQQLRERLDSGQALPAELSALTVRQIYFFARDGYHPAQQYLGEVSLFRASVGDGSQEDTPCADMYSDTQFGWSSRVRGPVQVFDMPGGHASMLQPPNVQWLADRIQGLIDKAQLHSRGGAPDGMAIEPRASIDRPVMSEPLTPSKLTVESRQL